MKNSPIIRYWMKCGTCGCTWFDDALQNFEIIDGNSFDGCPECGSDFEIFDTEETN